MGAYDMYVCVYEPGTLSWWYMDVLYEPRRSPAGFEDQVIILFVAMQSSTGHLLMRKNRKTDPEAGFLIGEWVRSTLTSA